MVNSFNSFLSEQEGLEPYKVICFFHTGDPVRDFSNTEHLEMMKVMLRNMCRKLKINQIPLGLWVLDIEFIKVLTQEQE